MRPVNLIPPDERRGDSAPLRTGVLIYVLIGGLTLLLLGIVAVALTSKQISDRESQKVTLQHQVAAAKAKADSVQAFTDFRTVQQNRASTVTSLAQSRFDWSRVMQEFVRVLPSDIQVISMEGTVSPAVQLDSSGSSSSSDSSSLRSSVAGPALSIVGCAPTQDAVAGFVASLENIDGVSSSKLGDQSSGSGSSGFSGEPGNASLGSGNDDCPSNVYKFSLVAAFDAVPTPSVSSGAPSSPTPATPPTSSSTAQVASASTGTGG
jgi:Tfp pilus assembly protein PilN